MMRRAQHDDGASTSARLAALTARHDQAMALIEDHLRTHTKAKRGGEANNKALVDALLDVRLALNPPPREDA